MNNKLQVTPVESICKWNDERYNQEFSASLTISLLEEELGETATAKNNSDTIEVLDGLGDTFYVAVGALWKTGLSHEQITSLLDNVKESMPALPSPTVALSWYKDDQTQLVLAILAVSCLHQLETELQSETLAMNVITAICISNNTKTATKTHKDIKASIDKGDGFIAPTDMLKTILRESKSPVGVRS